MFPIGILKQEFDTNHIREWKIIWKLNIECLRLTDKSEIYFTVEILSSYIKVKKVEQNVKTILYDASLTHLNLPIYVCENKIDETGITINQPFRKLFDSYHKIKMEATSSKKVKTEKNRESTLLL